jgi:predicted ArsR family transcriptional regulator
MDTRNEDRDSQLNRLLGVLGRREIEARILSPFIEALSEEFGAEKVLPVLQKTIIQIARRQGAQMAESGGGCGLEHFAVTLEAWKKDDALGIEVLEQTPQVFSFNVTHCRYADLYRELGVAGLGGILSCSRDFALIEGFNPDVQLERTQTIMEGAPHCDFRYRLLGEQLPKK